VQMLFCIGGTGFRTVSFGSTNGDLGRVLTRAIDAATKRKKIC
jgi:hypothetical protein